MPKRFTKDSTLLTTSMTFGNGRECHFFGNGLSYHAKHVMLEYAITFISELTTIKVAKSQKLLKILSHH